VGSGPDFSVEKPIICLATCEPDARRLSAQLDSIAAQSRGWSCIIADDASSPARLAPLTERIAGDARFFLLRGERRVGFYRNFERALAQVPRGARFVALCDQDDVWHPDKLARSIAALERAPRAMLAVSARRIVDDAGRAQAIAPAPRVHSIEALLLANQVAGAASVFRGELLERALPFPDADGAFHDHWLACVAQLTGGMVALDEPLVDYRQHDANAIGHRLHETGRAPLVRAMLPWRWPRAVENARRAIDRDWRRIEIFARELERRCGVALPAFTRGSVARLLALEARALYAGEAAGIAGTFALGLLAERIASRKPRPKRSSGSQYAPSAHSFHAFSTTNGDGRASSD
jgi:glycosyltransferase involved in cell wall biosynthesis